MQGNGNVSGSSSPTTPARPPVQDTPPAAIERQRPTSKVIITTSPSSPAVDGHVLSEDSADQSDDGGARNGATANDVHTPAEGAVSNSLQTERKDRVKPVSRSEYNRYHSLVHIFSHL